MNIAKVRNSAAIVNYVKPGMEIVEMEVESVLCTSGGETTPSKATFNVNSQVGSYSRQAQSPAVRR